MAEPRWLIVRKDYPAAQTLRLDLVELSRAGVVRVLHSDVLTGSDPRWGTAPRGSDYQLAHWVTRVSDSRAVLTVDSTSNALQAAGDFTQLDIWVGVINITGDTFTLGDLYYTYVWTESGVEMQELTGGGDGSVHVVDGSHVLMPGFERDATYADYPARTEWKVLDVSGSAPTMAWVAPHYGHHGWARPSGSRPPGPVCVADQFSTVGYYQGAMLNVDVAAHTVTAYNLNDPLTAPFSTPRSPVTNPGYPTPTARHSWVFDADHWMGSRNIVGDDGNMYEYLFTAAAPGGTGGAPTVYAFEELGWVSDITENDELTLIVARGYTWVLTELVAAGPVSRMGLVKVQMGAGATPWLMTGVVDRVVLQDNGSNYNIDSAIARSVVDMGNGLALAWGSGDGTSLDNHVWAAIVHDASDTGGSLPTTIAVSPRRLTLPGTNYVQPVFADVGTPSPLAPVPLPNGDPKVDLTGGMLAQFRAGVTVLGVVSTDPDPLP